MNIRITLFRDDGNKAQDLFQPCTGFLWAVITTLMAFLIRRVLARNSDYPVCSTRVCKAQCPEKGGHIEHSID